MNIILIVSDTFRQDHMGCYGNKRVHTPHLDQFAETCVQFDNCYFGSFPTMPMRADLFTGKFTFPYLGWNPLPLHERPLAEILHESSYATLAAVDTPFLVRDGYGYDRGFKDFCWIPGQGKGNHLGDEAPRTRSERRHEEDYCSAKTMTTAEKLLEYYHKEKFFLYIDTWDPHEPWDPPSWYVERYYPGYDGRIVRPSYWNWREKGLREEDVRIAHACYCGEITMVDHWLGRFLDKVKAMGLWEHTALVFTSDHGFYFGQHDLFGKGRHTGRHWLQSPLYQELTRVPLLVYVPGVKPRKVRALVSSVDIMPTILELVGEEVPRTVQGESLVPLIRGERDTLRGFAVSSHALQNPGEQSRAVDGRARSVDEPHPTTVSTLPWTFLYSTEDYPAELYNIEHDPQELHNVIGQNWSEAEKLHRKLIQFLEGVGTDECYLATRQRLFRS